MDNNELKGGWKNPPPFEIKELLETAKVIAVVGISSKPDRPSNGVSGYLKKKGYKIIPVNPRETDVHGEKAYPDLESIPDNVDIVDVFRRGEEAPGIVEMAKKIGARAVWLQEGIVSEKAFSIARKIGITIVMNRCILKQHAELIG